MIKLNQIVPIKYSEKCDSVLGKLKLYFENRCGKQVYCKVGLPGREMM